MSSDERWHCYADRRDGAGTRRVEREEIAALVKAGTLLWVDVLDPTRDETAWMGDVFGFHELALSDLHNNAVRPKQELYGGVLFTVFRAVNLIPGKRRSTQSI